MKIQNIRAMTGPNIFHHRPVLIMTLDLEDLTEISSDVLPGFTQRLCSLLPGLFEHRCSPGHPGGLIERLDKGTYFAHIVEHVALEISVLAGIGVGFGKSLYADSPGIYQVIVRYQNEAGMCEVLRASVELADALAHNLSFDLGANLTAIKKTVGQTELGPSSMAIINAAEVRDVPWQRLDDVNLVQLGYGKYRKIIQAATSCLTSDIAVDIAQDKDLTKRFLRKGGINVPFGKVVQSSEEAQKVFEEVKCPVVVKPLNGNHGRGVSINLTSKEDIASAFDLAQVHSKSVIVEECFVGLDYRVVVVGGKMVAAALREAAHVIGDGIHSVAELVALENMNPLRGDDHEKPLTRITIDSSTELVLLRNKTTLDMVPDQGEKVYLRATANISTGGIARDVTELVHDEIRLLCERAAKLIGLDICGIDLITPDISRPLQGQSAGIIEVNAGPGLRMHHFPHAGRPRDVGLAIIDFLYPGNQNGRIPIISVTGTNGKTTVTRLIAHIISQTGITVGSTTTDGIFLNNNLISRGDTTGPISAQSILFDPSVELAVFETARGGIVRKGLGYDWSDVGIITNVTLDHLGQDNIRSVDDILKIKSLVIERVREGGSVILNADSPELVAWAQNSCINLKKRNLIYFSISNDNDVIKNHIAKGGTACYLKGDSIYYAVNGMERFVAESSDLPLTINSSAIFHVANALVAIAACKSIGLPVDLILQGLSSFDHNINNRGRTNLYHVNDGYVLLDYAHNPEAFLNIGDMIAKWNSSRLTGVIGVPGDRCDELIKMSGMASAHAFKKIIIREDADLRGRAAGETAHLIRLGVLEENTNVSCMVVLSSEEALIRAVNEMIPGEVVAYFYEHFEEIENLLLLYGAKKISPASMLDRPYHHYHKEQSWQQL